MADVGVTQKRLEDQIAWYDGRSRRAQSWYKTLKVVQIISAALVPLLAGFNAPRAAIGAIGVLIVVLEGLQQLNQYHDHWIGYRSTCEALKHEKYLFEAASGPYATIERPERLLAERVESLISQEHAKWISAQEAARRAKDPHHPGG